MRSSSSLVYLTLRQRRVIAVSRSGQRVRGVGDSRRDHRSDYICTVCLVLLTKVERLAGTRLTTSISEIAC
jgi:hypothetical protein